MVLNDTKSTVVSFHRISTPVLFAYSVNGTLLARSVVVTELRQLHLPTLRSRRLVADIVFPRGVLTAEIDSTDLLSRVNLRCSRPSRSRDLF
ncbi:hypothetical protein J6590_072787 [Homalodisca vitripennis]|nr:hypothetical protein J6590_072787 [Homalodisca vitripennis]